MKTLSTLLFAVAAAVSFNANADSLYGDPSMGDIFPIQDTVLQAQDVTTVRDTGQLVWSVEYEEYVNPADFNAAKQGQTLASALQAMDNNPPAAGHYSDSTFIWDATAGEYQLQ